MKTERCGNCRFAERYSDDGDSYSCRRRAPQRFELNFVLYALCSIAASLYEMSGRDREKVDGVINAMGEAGADGVFSYTEKWPTVNEHNWCGEYEAASQHDQPDNVVNNVTSLRKSLGRLYGIVKDMERDAK
jgi:hypothetical protein